MWIDFFSLRKIWWEVTSLIFYPKISQSLWNEKDFRLYTESNGEKKTRKICISQTCSGSPTFRWKPIPGFEFSPSDKPQQQIARAETIILLVLFAVIVIVLMMVMALHQQRTFRCHNHWLVELRLLHCCGCRGGRPMVLHHRWFGNAVEQQMMLGLLWQQQQQHRTTRLDGNGWRGWGGWFWDSITERETRTKLPLRCAAIYR